MTWNDVVEFAWPLAELGIGVVVFLAGLMVAIWVQKITNGGKQ